MYDFVRLFYVLTLFGMRVELSPMNFNFLFFSAELLVEMLSQSAYSARRAVKYYTSAFYIIENIFGLLFFLSHSNLFWVH